jgi:hypothetical protein
MLNRVVGVPQLEHFPFTADLIEFHFKGVIIDPEPLGTPYIYLGILMNFTLWC